MTEPGTAVAAGRLLPAACPPGPKAVTRPPLSERSLGKLGRATGRCGGGESPPPPHTPPSWAPAAWGGGGEAAGPGIQAGRGAGVIRELTADRKGPRPPRVRMAGQLVAEGPRRGKLGGRLGDAGSSWGVVSRGGQGDTYLINWPRSSHRVSQPGHLHSPCPYRGWEPGVSSWEELGGQEEGRCWSGTLKTLAALRQLPHLSSSVCPGRGKLPHP